MYNFQSSATLYIPLDWTHDFEFADQEEVAQQ